jgi:uncharacterized protein (TIGR03083 family)
LEDEARTLLALADGADLTRPVAACPGWSVADLLAHLTGVYRWADLIVRERREAPPSAEERAALNEGGHGEPDPLRTLSTAHARLVTDLRAAQDGMRCWTMWPAGDDRHYWIRRQAHETLIHRVDVQIAVSGGDGGGMGLDPAVATDGVDELLMGFTRRFRRRLRTPQSHTVRFHATDTGHSWWMRIGPSEPEFGTGMPDAPAGTEVHGRSHDLLLLLWNRRDTDGLTVTGPATPLQMWRSDAHI